MLPCPPEVFTPLRSGSVTVRCVEVGEGVGHTECVEYGGRDRVMPGWVEVDPVVGPQAGVPQPTHPPHVHQQCAVSRRALTYVFAVDGDPAPPPRSGA